MASRGWYAASEALSPPSTPSRKSGARVRSREEETTTLARRPPAPIGAVLRLVGGEGSPSSLRLERGSCVIGAGAEADLIIEHRTVSRRHVELALVAEGVSVRDLDSRNGTFYLGQRIERAVLALGSRLRLGSVELAIEADTDALAVAIDDAALEALPAYRGLHGAAPGMRKLSALLQRLEGSLVGVLVEGESGVGKELVARAIHEGSTLTDGPLVVVNCGAIGRELVLSELFGHKKGAFTGAHEDRIGAFEAADGGTLFLDEVGELPLEVQPTLLRALESGEVKPVGETRARQVRVRLVAATNRDLRREVDAGRFREDLYYRLAVVKLTVPPLRERLEDVPLLARHFARDAGAGELPPDLLEDLGRRQWRGNVRELRNAVLAYLAVGSLPDGPLAPDIVAAALRGSLDFGTPYQEQKDAFVEVFSRVYFEALLARTGGNQSEAARISGVERSYFGKLLTKFGVKP
jgi:DNA-binding NtrC family response regulator